MSDILSLAGSGVALLGLGGAAFCGYRMYHANMMNGGWVWVYATLGSVVVVVVGAVVKTLADRKAED